MYWRIPRQEFQRNYGQGNRLLLQRAIEEGKTPGILAYHEGRPVGWCSIAPREDFPVLGRSPTLRPIDDLPVWSIVCFFVAGPLRRSGMTHAMIRAAIQYAQDHGARIIEAYPIDPETKSLEYERYMGLTTTYEAEGFIVVCRRSLRRPIMRYFVR
jgi:GNAT superfamily N-acetyltransferase